MQEQGDKMNCKSVHDGLVVPHISFISEIELYTPPHDQPGGISGNMFEYKVWCGQHIHRFYETKPTIEQNRKNLIQAIENYYTGRQNEC